jgi:hypothetical protein
MQSEKLINNLASLLKEKIFEYPNRQAHSWQRCYDSIDAFAESTKINRNKWIEIIKGADSFFIFGDPIIKESGAGEFLISFKNEMSDFFNAIYRQPSSNSAQRFPLVICLHGIDGTPEMAFGENKSLKSSYHEFGSVLNESGFAVLAPRLINNFADRAKINRLALLLGSNIWTIEIRLIRQLLQCIIDNFPVDENRIGAWGISMGGAYVLYSMPIEARFSVGIISAWFNHRLKKMVVEDSRYSCFLSSSEEHAFLPGLLTEFSDQDLVSLICPRPLLIQTGEHDPVSYSPLVREEYEAASAHYQKLKINERIEWLLHPGDHEAHVESGLRFLKKWL